jgi:hypothetical protein
MAIGTAVNWDVRPSTGSNLNGGGFNPTIAGAGTDYSQQAVAQLTKTDLTTTSGVSTNLSSATGGFTSAMIGNCIYIASGTNFIPGYYFIVGFISANTVNLDRASSTSAGSGGNGRVGGSTASISGQGVPLGSVVVAGNDIFVKNEAWSENAVISVAGSTAFTINLVGYNLVHGDEPTGSNRPHNARAGGSGGITSNVNRVRIKNIIVSGSAGSGFSTTFQCIYINCRATGNTSHGFNVGGVMESCQSDGNTANGVNVTGILILNGCYLTGNLGNGVGTTTMQVQMTNSISAFNFAHGFFATTAQIGLINNTFHFNGIFGVADGLNVTTPTVGSYIANNIFSSNTRYGMNATAGGSVPTGYNNFFGNATAPRNNFLVGTGDLAVDPQYKNAGSGDYRIGVNLKAKGIPTQIYGATGTIAYIDIGAVQRKEIIQRASVG